MAEDNDGQKMVRDGQGRFTKGTTLSSEEARRRVQGRWAKDVDEVSRAFLEAAGFVPDDTPPWVVQTAKVCARGGSGFAGNLRLFFEQAGLAKKDNGPERGIPKLGEMCPTCKHVVSAIPPELAYKLATLAQKYIDERKDQKSS